jgi:hypothetical protein
MACFQYTPAVVRKLSVATFAAFAPRQAALPPACGPAMRRPHRVAMIAAALTALATIRPATAAPAAKTPAATSQIDRPLTRLLPQTRNRKLCFTAHFAEAPVALFDYGGHQTRRLESITAELYWDDAAPIDYSKDGWGYDRRYQILLAAKVEGHKKLVFGGLECPYRDRALIDPKSGETIDGPSAIQLDCFKDCSESSITVEAPADGKALVLAFEKDKWVSMSGARDEDTVDLRPASATRLRLEPAPASACRPINERYRP